MGWRLIGRGKRGGEGFSKGVLGREKLSFEGCVNSERLREWGKGVRWLY